MRIRDLSSRTAAWLLVSAMAFAVACAASVVDPAGPDPFSAESFADYPDQEILGEEEVLYDDYGEDEFGRPEKTKTGKAGEFLVVASYVGMIVASFVLPLLAL